MPLNKGDVLTFSIRDFETSYGDNTEFLLIEPHLSTNHHPLERYSWDQNKYTEWIWGKMGYSYQPCQSKYISIFRFNGLKDNVFSIDSNSSPRQNKIQHPSSYLTSLKNSSKYRNISWRISLHKYPPRWWTIPLCEYGSCRYVSCWIY